MNKTSNCIKMLGILSSGRLYSRVELAELLGTNVRNIVEYKKELENASWAENEGEYAMGYHIMSFSGKNGGYQLDTNANIPAIPLTREEKRAFSEGASYLDAATNFTHKREFKLALAKVNSAISNTQYEQPIVSIDTRQLAMSYEEISRRYDIISDAISTRHTCSITYLCSDNIVRERCVDFYDLFLYNNAWFGIGYSHASRDISYFKFSRIVTIEREESTFYAPSRNIYNPRDYYDENGLKVSADWHKGEDSEWIHIRLRLNGKPAMYAKEYRYGKNQTIDAVSPNETILECDMQYRYNTIRFVMGLGKDCEVLEPMWLREEILENIAAIRNKYA